MAGTLRTPVRIHVRFAAVLLAALAASLLLPAPELAVTVALITGSVAGTALALAVSFPRGAPAWLSSIALAAALAAGLFAALAGMPGFALFCQILAAAAIFGVSVSHLTENPRIIFAGLGAVSLFLAGMALMGEGPGQASLFFAASLGLVARTLQSPVADANARIELPIGGKRA